MSDFDDSLNKTRNSLASKGLVRSETDKKLGGVCGGIAQHYNMDPTLVRVLMVILIVALPGPGWVIYPIAWALMPTARVSAPVDTHTVTSAVPSYSDPVYPEARSSMPLIPTDDVPRPAGLADPSVPTQERPGQNAS